MLSHFLAPGRARASSQTSWEDCAEQDTLTCRRVVPERGVIPEEEEAEAEGGISGPRIPLLKRESAMGPKLGGSRKFEDVGGCGGR